MYWIFSQQKIFNAEGAQNIMMMPLEGVNPY